MADDHADPTEPPPTDLAEPPPTHPAEQVDGVDADEALEAEVDAYDLDGDGKISLVEEARATLGVVDARMEELADEGGIRGNLANAAHQVLDRLDNDETPRDEPDS